MTLETIIGWVLTTLVGGFGLIVLWQMATGKIDLSKLVSEPDGSGASLSRFQFLIFTFVISMCLFWVIVEQKSFPIIPNGIFVLLGISSSSYLISKGIQNSGNNGGQPGGAGAGR